MRQPRKIPVNPDVMLYYLVDANFLANRHINERKINDQGERDRVSKAKQWWAKIAPQLKSGKARVYILDLCIAEAFRVLAKKYYNNEEIFKNASSYRYAKKKLSEDLCLSSKEAQASSRIINYHDIQTNRDIIISVDRFFEKAWKKSKKFGKTSIVDLLILATSKYLVDFFGIPRAHLFLITQDNGLYQLAKSYADLPMVFNPSVARDSAAKVFRVGT